MTRIEPLANAREDRGLRDVMVLQAAMNLALLIFGRSLSSLPRAQRHGLIGACEEFIEAQLDEHAPPTEDEPCAMSAAKYEAES